MPSIKGTASVTDNRALNKRLASMKFPANFTEKLDVEKVNRAVMTQWIEQKITELLGFEDEIVQSTAVNLFLPTRIEDGPKAEVDPKKAQIDLEGFLGEGPAAEFAAQVYTLLLDAQASGVGVPKRLVEEKKKELEAQKAQAGRQPAARGPPQQQQQQQRDYYQRNDSDNYGRGGLPPPQGGAPPPPPARRSVSPERDRRDEFGRTTRPADLYRDSDRRPGGYDSWRGDNRGRRDDGAGGASGGNCQTGENFRLLMNRLQPSGVYNYTQVSE